MDLDSITMGNLSACCGGDFIALLLEYLHRLLLIIQVDIMLLQDKEEHHADHGKVSVQEREK